MIDNNREIILEYFVAFNLSFVGKIPLQPIKEPQFVHS